MFQTLIRPINRAIEDEFDNFFNKLPLPISWPTGSVSWRPAINLVEDDTSIEVSIALSGIDMKDVDIEVDEGVLSISGKKEFVKEEKKRYHLIEHKYGEFKRTISIPSNIDTENIKAALKDGLLTVTLPKKEETKKKKIEVKICN